MSTPPSSINDQQSSIGSSAAGSAEEADAESADRNVLQFGERAPSPLRFAGFWAAIALPFLHTPLLVSGLDSPSRVAAYAGLLVLNFVALVVGHQHNRG